MKMDLRGNTFSYQWFCAKTRFGPEAKGNSEIRAFLLEGPRSDNISQQGRVVRKLFNANPGLKVNRSSNFSSIKMFFTDNVLCRLRLFKLKTEGQTI